MRRSKWSSFGGRGGPVWFGFLNSMLPADFYLIRVEHVTKHPAARKWMVEMQPVDQRHHRKINRRYRLGMVIKAAPAELQKLDLPGQRKLVLAVDHRLALSMPALLSALAKKSFSSASSPIFACKTFTSTNGGASAVVLPKISAAPATS